MNRPPRLLQLAPIVVLVFLACLLVMDASTSWAISYRVLVSSEAKQLRTARLRVQGQSTLPASANATAHKASATDAAVGKAIARVREDLEGKLRQRKLELELVFLGAPPQPDGQNARDTTDARDTMHPEHLAAVRKTAAFIHRVDDLDSPPGQSPQVEVDLDIVYILQQLEADSVDAASSAGQTDSADALPLTTPQGGTFTDVDRNASERRVLQELLQRLQQLEGGE